MNLRRRPQYGLAGSIRIFILLLWLAGAPPVNAQADTLLRAPVVGLSTNAGVPILVKGVSDGNVRLRYRLAGQAAGEDSTTWNELREVSDFTATIFLPSVNASEDYEYRAEFDGGATTPWYRFHTPPEAGTQGKFDFVFSACFRDTYQPHPVFEQILGLDPTFVALLGDSMYGDFDGNLNAGSAGSFLPAFRLKYQRNFDSYFQAMSSQIPIMATWDDHDYGIDNSDRNYPHQQVAKQVFKETFPTYPYAADSGGIYYRFAVADVDLFVLDTRWYRSPMEAPNGPQKTMLGEEQLAWLLDGLQQSQSAFKIVISSVSLNNYGGDKSSGRAGIDSWAGYLVERDLIMAHISANNLSGVVFFSGDQHYPGVNIINWSELPESEEFTDNSSVYTLSELGSAVLDISASPFNYKRAGGLAAYDQRFPDPEYSYEIFRAPWAYPGVSRSSAATSVYGHAIIDTESPIPTMTVSFYQLDDQTGGYDQIYQIVVRGDLTNQISSGGEIPEYFQLHNNFPNPFNPSTTLRFDLPEVSVVSLVIYNILGRNVTQLAGGRHEAAYHKVQWGGKDSQGRDVPSGIYIARLETKDFTQAIKMVLMK